MGKTKVYELAKKFNKTSKEIIDIALKLKIDVKSHLSSLEDKDVLKIEEKLNAKPNDDKLSNETAKGNKKESKKGKNESPVIIRREVIISDEEIKKREEEEKKKKQATAQKEVGFLERERKKDFNIVYRNKPTKPMTVSELFGLKEKSKEEDKPKAVQKVEVKKEEKEQTKVQNEQRPYNNKTNNNSYTNTNRKQEAGKNNNQRTNNNFNQRNNNRNNFNNGYNNQNRKSSLNNREIEKNIKNIVASDIIEKESVREYNKNISKQKNNDRYNDKTRKTSSKSRRNNNGEFDEDKLKSLKQESKLSNMFHDQDGGMLDYYDLTTTRGRKNKKKPSKDDSQRNKQKIFQLTEITIPETITVKDFAAEMKKTSGEVIKKLLQHTL